MRSCLAIADHRWRRCGVAGLALALWLSGCLTGMETARAEPPADEPLKIHILSGSRSYKSEESLREFQQQLEKKYRVACTASWSRDGATMIDNLEQLKTADLLLVFTRRMKLVEEQMAVVRNHWEQGKPIVALRTASHAFQAEDNEVFDRQVLGGNYRGYGGQAFAVLPVAEAAQHPILAGVASWESHTMYNTGELAKGVVVLQTGPKGRQAVSWTHEHQGGRVFYSSLGIPQDFQNENFRRLLTNALFWTAQRDPEKMKR